MTRGPTAVTESIGERRADGDVDTQALFEEARRLRRRRWFVTGSIVLLVGAVSTSYLLGTGGGVAPPAAPVTHAPVVHAPVSDAPTVDVKAFDNHGMLAFVSNDNLWVLSGPGGFLREVSQGEGDAADPKFSPDGEWLAFTNDGQVWIANADGTTSRPVPGAQPGEDLSWSPHGDLPAGAGAGVVDVTDGGGDPVMTSQPGDSAWSPDGSELAFVTTVGQAELLEEMPAAGGSSVVWLRLPFQPANPSANSPAVPNQITVAAVLPNQEGLLYWLDPDSADAADGQNLYLVKDPGSQPIHVGATLVASDSIAVSSTGEFAIVDGFNRDAWQTKTLELCSPSSGACTHVGAPPSDVTIDPAWSPDGESLAFVEAPSSSSGGFPQSVVQRWYATHTLWTVGASSNLAHEISGTNGATVPVWAQDGQSLMYEADNALWLVPSLSSKPVEVASPLFLGDLWPTYYGQVDWTQQFDWSAP